MRIIVDAPGEEMPKKCADCPLFDYYIYGCRFYSYGIPARYGYDINTKPKWCEMKELEVGASDGN